MQKLARLSLAVLFFVFSFSAYKPQIPKLDYYQQGVESAPSDGTTYGVNNGAWTAISVSGYLKLDQTTAQTVTASPILDWLTASKVAFTDASKKLTSTGIGLSTQFIKGDGSLDSTSYLSSVTADSPLSGAGTSASHLGLTVLKDLVAGTGLSGGANDVLPGADSDVTFTLGANQNIGVMTFGFDGGGAAISAGKTVTVTSPVAFTITGWYISATTSSNAVIDILFGGVSKAGTEIPTLAGATSANDVSLTTWTDTSVAAGDVWTASVTSGTATCVTVVVFGNKT